MNIQWIADAQSSGNGGSGAHATAEIHVGQLENENSFGYIVLTAGDTGSVINYASNLGAGTIIGGNSGSFSIGEFITTTIASAPTYSTQAASDAYARQLTNSDGTASSTIGLRYSSNFTVVGYSLPA
jgi:hypothetical protein